LKHRGADRIAVVAFQNFQFLGVGNYLAKESSRSDIFKKQKWKMEKEL